MLGFRLSRPTNMMVLLEACAADIKIFISLSLLLFQMGNLYDGPQ